MPAALLFVEDDGPGLVFEAEPALDGLDRLLEVLRRDRLVRRRVEAQRKQELFAARSLRDRIGLVQRPVQVVRDEAPDVVDLDMLVLGLEQVVCELFRAAALAALEDHRITLPAARGPRADPGGSARSPGRPA